MGCVAQCLAMGPWPWRALPRSCEFSIDLFSAEGRLSDPFTSARPDVSFSCGTDSFRRRRGAAWGPQASLRFLPGGWLPA